MHILFKNSNSAVSALTLNVNGKGAKPIYINGEPSSIANYNLPSGTYLSYYEVAGAYNSTTKYKKGNLCIYNNLYYRCLTPTTGDFDSDAWSQVSNNSAYHIYTDGTMTGKIDWYSIANRPMIPVIDADGTLETLFITETI